MFRSSFSRSVRVSPALGARPLAALSVAALLCAVTLSASAAAAPSDGGFAQALSEGPLYATLAAFASGLLVSFTPCVYPMVAVTVSVFGARSVKSRFEGFLLSAAFVAGIVLMFVPLGVVAGLTGGVFGSLLSSPWVIVSLSALFLVLAASMFGAFELDLPSGLKNRLASSGGSGFWGALVLGMICGPIAAPCTGPFLTGILAWIAKTQSAAFGAGLMAAFAIGLGVPFFLVGTFALQLPKSGRWMMHVKSVLGLVLVVVALYFLSSAFPALAAPARSGLAFAAGCAVVIALGLALGAVHRPFDGASAGVRLSKAAGVLLTAGGAFLLLMGAIKPERTLAWEAPLADGPLGPLTAQARQRALAESRPLLVDFTASWCVACKEMERETFNDERVQREAGRFLAVRVDVTDDEDPRVKATTKEHAVIGLPTVILFRSDGAEAQRFNYKVEAEEFLTSLERIN
ncbi:MAG: cytochrome c biogenesis protein CcdA [Deltaproteobacteria bacterium]